MSKITEQPFTFVQIKSKRGGRSRQLASAGFASPSLGIVNERMTGTIKSTLTRLSP
jgi:hypothetical protein